MKPLITRYAKWIALVPLGAYLLMTGVGMALQYFFGASAHIASILGTAEIRLLPALALTSWAAVGALLVARRPKHPIGWIFLANALLFALDDLALGYAFAGHHLRPDSLLTGLAIIWLYWSGTALTMFTGTLLFLLFPTGRLLSPRWRYPAFLSGGALAFYVLFASISPMPAFVETVRLPTDLVPVKSSIRALAEPLMWASLSLAMACALVSLGSLIVRLYRSRGIERQQIKWFVYTGGLLLPTLLLLFFGVLPNSPAPPWTLPLSAVVMTVFVMSLGVSAALAILRYRLWDIDILIRRTLIYGSLSVLLAVLYFGMVTALQNVVVAATGQRSQAVIVISTLAIAAGFNPLRSRMQTMIDRRFYRGKYDAGEIFAHFGANAQLQVEVEPLIGDLLAAVEQTMEPESLSLLLREP